MDAKVSPWIPLIVYIAACISDTADGYIARKYHLVTDFGKLMDPLADKLLNETAFILLTANGLVEPIITVVVIGREFLITGLRAIAMENGKAIAADIWGKLKTIFQDVAIVWILFVKATSLSGNFYSITTQILIWTMFVLTLISAVNYVLHNKEIFKNM